MHPIRSIDSQYCVPQLELPASDLRYHVNRVEGLVPFLSKDKGGQGPFRVGGKVTKWVGQQFEVNDR